MTTSPTNVFLLVVDSLRYDRLSCYGHDKPTSPFLDSIATNGVKFERAYAPAPWTVPVHGSIFSGQLPSYHGSHQKSKSFNIPAEESLAGALTAVDYRTAGFSANPWISSELNFDTGFDHFERLSGTPPFPEESTAPDSTIDDLYSLTGARNVLQWVFDGNSIKRFANGFWKRYLDTGARVTKVNEAILEWVRDNQSEQMFVFANYMDVHDPHFDDLLSRSDLQLPSASTRLEVSERRYRAAYSKRVDFWSEPDDPERGRQLYDQSIRRVDEGIRNLFSELENSIDLNNSLVIIIGDHGECLGDKNYWGHGTYLHEPLIRIPLLISPPENSEPLDSSKPTSLLDVTEYIAEITGAPIETTGETMTQSFSEDRPIFAESIGPRMDMKKESLKNGFEAVIQGSQKLVRNRTTGETEMVRIAVRNGQAGADSEQLEALLKDQWGEIDHQTESNEAAISDEMKSRLSDLGYL